MDLSGEFAVVQQINSLEGEQYGVIKTSFILKESYSFDIKDSSKWSHNTVVYFDTERSELIQAQIRFIGAENEANEFLSTVMRPASDDPKVCNCIQLSALCSQLRTQIDQLIIDRQNLETRVRTLEQDVSQLKSRDDIVAAPSCAETSLNGTFSEAIGRHNISVDKLELEACLLPEKDIKGFSRLLDTLQIEYKNKIWSHMDFKSREIIENLMALFVEKRIERESESNFHSILSSKQSSSNAKIRVQGLKKSFEKKLNNINWRKQNEKNTKKVE